ncbi:MAG: L-seryl-tRNA(Sec) selenium transferase [Armatimonadetes bacterium]|nr:L-seryl-tRNA(Sec) selenium transferase [Armatimonadota bacterium]
MDHDLLRQLPSVDTLLQTPELAAAIAEYGHEVVVTALRAVLDDRREAIRQGDAPDVSAAAVAALALVRLRQQSLLSIRPAINATGVIIHTALGRAVLSQAAQEAIAAVMRGYCTLQIDLGSGGRGHRDEHIEGLLKQLTGCEAATTVNNNAAATMLILNTLAQGKEVIVARGQLVEIGGAFRMPEVMAMSGCLMREVGTTNKTHLRDYAAAIGENTGAILRVHHSNYRIIGFAEEPGIRELCQLGHEHGVPVIDDLGSGALLPMEQFGVGHEPMIQESVRAGADVVCCSGDKLLGAPQAGVIVGKAEWVQRIRKNPLSRALRTDKLTAAGLEATLRLFLNPERLREVHPLYRALSLTPEQVGARAQAVGERLQATVGGAVAWEVRPDSSRVGSGSLPEAMLPTMVLALRPRDCSAENLANSLRHQEPPVVARVQRDSVLLDFRTVLPGEDEVVAKTLVTILGQTGQEKTA